MELIILITIIILILSCIKIIEGFSNEVIYVKSRIDNRKYLVQNLNHTLMRVYQQNQKINNYNSIHDYRRKGNTKRI
jgi:hypothetical protein